MSGDALKVAVTDAQISVNATIASSVEINNDSGNPIPIAGGNTLAMRMEGITSGIDHNGYNSVIPIMVAGSTGYNSIPVRVAGVTGGTPLLVANQVDGTFDITDITGAVTLPTGAATDATLSELANTIGSTLGLLGVTLDMMLQKFPGGIEVDPLDGTKILPSNSQVDLVVGHTNSTSVYSAITATHTQTVAGAVDSAKMKVKIAEGDIAVPSSFVTGSKDVNASSVQITTNPTTLNNGINIKGHPRNEDHIWVTQDDTANNGYPLGAGEELFLDINDLNKVYVYADQTGLTACYIYR
jgi:hypothetical protein